MSDQLPDPRLRKVYRLEATLGSPLDLGEVAQGRRRIVPQTGGRFTGPEISGELLPGASADWQIVLPDGTSFADIRYTLQTDGGDLLYVRSRGVRHGDAKVLARLGRGESVDASEYIFPYLNPHRDRGPAARLAEQKPLNQCRRPAAHGRDLRDLPGRMNSPAEYNNRQVAIITGASQGIGAGLTKAYRELGYAVIATARSIGPSEDSGIVTVGGDIGDPDTAQRVVGEAVERFGRIDTLINNAGIYIGKPFMDYTLEDFNALIAVNLAGFFHMTTRTIKHMLDQGYGHVVNVSTTLVEQADSSRPAALQIMTKGGLVAVTRSLAIEYASLWFTGKRRVAWRDQNGDPRRELLRGDGRVAPYRSGRRDRGRGRWGPISRVGAFRDRRGLAHRRRPKCRTLTVRYLVSVKPARRPCSPVSSNKVRPHSALWAQPEWEG